MGKGYGIGLRTLRDAASVAGLGYLGYKQWKGTATDTRYSRPYKGVGTQTLTTQKRKRTKNSHSFKGQMLKYSAAKHYPAFQLQALPHNAIYSGNVTAGIVQGTADNQRIGDQIHLAALKIKGSMQTPTTTGGYTFRIMVGYSGEEYPSAGFTVQLTPAELFLPTTTTNWVTNGIVNPKAFTCLFDQTLDLNSLTSDTIEVQSFAFTVQLDKDFPYQAAASPYGKDKNLYVVVMADKGGGAGVDIATSLTMSWDLIFKET